MALLNHPPEARLSLRVLALLLGYPDRALLEQLGAMRHVLHQERALSAAQLDAVDRLLAALAGSAPLEAEADYVQLFEQARSTSLHLFEHVHGDSRERGPAMVELARTYQQAGLILAPGELPDYLPVVLQFASTLAPQQARDFLGELAHILNALFGALAQRHSPYAGALGALLELAGEQPSPVSIEPDLPPEESWEEPKVFDGCSSKGQSRPGATTPIHIVRNHAATGVRP